MSYLEFAKASFWIRRKHLRTTIGQTVPPRVSAEMVTEAFPFAQKLWPFDWSNQLELRLNVKRHTLSDLDYNELRDLPTILLTITNAVDYELE